MMPARYLLIVRVLQSDDASRSRAAFPGSAPLPSVRQRCSKRNVGKPNSANAASRNPAHHFCENSHETSETKPNNWETIASENVIVASYCIDMVAVHIKSMQKTRLIQWH